MTVGAVVDRLYRSYLYPPDNKPVRARLGVAIDNAVTTVNVTNFQVPEDEELLANGSQIEIDSELMDVTAYNDLTGDATVVRGVDGTTAAAHLINARVTLDPPYTRLSVFEAVADNITTLYPKLYTINHTSVVQLSGGIAPLDDELAVEVVSAWPYGLQSADEVPARILDFHASVGGRAVEAESQSGQLWLRYRRRFGDATDETDALEDLGVERRWVNIILAGAAADLLAGKDVPETHAQWVSATLQAETVPVGTRGGIARQLAEYRIYLLENAAKEMRAEYRAQGMMRPVNRVTVRSAFG